MKIKGAELKEFMETGWPKEPDSESWYWDHDLFDDEPDPEETYDTDDLGALLFSGPRYDDPSDGMGLNLATQIRRWRKERASSFFSIWVPKDKEAEFKAFLKSIKGSIVK